MRILLAILLLALPNSSGAELAEADGVIGLFPAGETSCAAIEFHLDPGASLGALSWYHNDGSIAFPEVLLVEGACGIPPDLNQGALVLEALIGESLAWGDVTFETPVTSSTNIIYAVFMFPPYQERVGDGENGGPGIGYWESTQEHASFVSFEGVQWMRMHPSFSLAVAPTVVAGKGSAVLLSSLARVDRVGIQPAEQETPTVTTMGRPFPNPFNPRVEIPFELATHGRINLVVYDVRGRHVRQLLHEDRSAGRYRYPWLGDDNSGSKVASGVYFVVLQAPDAEIQQRVTLLR